MKKVVFIINSIQNQRCIKRIEDFVANGYEVEAYGFSRKSIFHTQPKNFSLTIIGEFSNNMSYLMRSLLMFRSIKMLSKKYSKANVYFYYFALDIALLFRLLIKKPYFYEESDLAHTYIGNRIGRKLLDVFDKKIIRNSFETVLTSEGFYQYHFGDSKIGNVSIIPNRLNKRIVDLPEVHKQEIDFSKLRIGFVGGARFNSVLNFSSTFAKSFPQHTFHFFGNPMSHLTEFEKLNILPNIFFHGSFSNPNDLPDIYSKIDLVLSTYDVEFDNVRYAEPNKIYEAIYFRTPIIVSKETFLSDKVEKLNLGYSINPLNDEEIIEFINRLTIESYNDKVRSLNLIPKEDAIDENSAFFKKL